MNDPLLGRVFGEKYTLLRRLNAGSHGVVYEASCEEMPRVAIKILRVNTNKNPQMIKRFQREAMITSQLQSPHVIKVFEAGVTPDDLSWIAMEYLEGETLAQHISQKKRLSPPEFMSIISPLCEALIEAHERGFLHRDIKPQNVMMVPHGAAKRPILLDFGIAAVQDEDSLTSSGLIHGTPQFMAPEQWEGLRNATPRSDLYSLGLLSYQALSGRMPYSAKNIMGWMRAHMTEVPSPLASLVPELPVGVSDAIMRAIEKSPADRFESIRDFFVALQQSTPPE